MSFYSLSCQWIGLNLFVVSFYSLPPFLLDKLCFSCFCNLFILQEFRLNSSQFPPTLVPGVGRPSGVVPKRSSSVQTDPPTGKGDLYLVFISLPLESSLSLFPLSPLSYLSFSPLYPTIAVSPTPFLSIRSHGSHSVYAIYLSPFLPLYLLYISLPPIVSPISIHVTSLSTDVQSNYLIVLCTLTCVLFCCPAAPPTIPRPGTH